MAEVDPEPEARPVPTGRQVLVLDPTDNVAVALRDLMAGEEVLLDVRRLTMATAIAVGHKLALEPIIAGGSVRKYGEVIGVARTAIAPGEHAHVHNVISARLPGPVEVRA
jgi:altronate dehydratase